MKAIYDPLNPPYAHKQFVTPEDFKGFDQDRINKIREVRQIDKNRKVRTTLCLMRDSDELKTILKSRLKKMGFIIKKAKPGPLLRLAKRTGIATSKLSTYFNHNRHIWNEAKGKRMSYISAMQLFILCIFAGVKLSLRIEFEPLEFETPE